jgi:hypothetical protein
MPDIEETNDVYKHPDIKVTNEVIDGKKNWKFYSI